MKELCLRHLHKSSSHQTGRVELLFAGAAGLLGQGVVGAVDHGEADHAVFHSLKALVHVVLPQSQALHDATILNTVMFLALNESLFAPVSD